MKRGRQRAALMGAFLGVVVVLAGVLAAASRPTAGVAGPPTGEFPNLGRWRDPNVRYCVVSPDLERPARDAFAAWAIDPRVSVDATFTGLCNSVVRDDGVNEIGYWEGPRAGYAEAYFPPLKAGIAAVLNHIEGGEYIIHEADIFIAGHAGQSDEGGLTHVLTHEIGHLYGLDHSTEACSIMFAGVDEAGQAKEGCHRLTRITAADRGDINAKYSRDIPLTEAFIPWAFKAAETDAVPPYARAIYDWDGNSWTRWVADTPAYVNDLSVVPYRPYQVLFDPAKAAPEDAEACVMRPPRPIVPGVNLACNGGFERPLDESWFGNFEWPAGESHSGRGAAVHTRLDDCSGRWTPGQLSTWIRASIPVDSGTTYELRFWVKGKPFFELNPAALYVAFRAYDAGGNLLAGDSGSTFAGTTIEVAGEWTEVKFRYGPAAPTAAGHWPPGIASVELAFQGTRSRWDLCQAGADSIVWIDEVSLAAVDQ